MNAPHPDTDTGDLLTAAQEWGAEKATQDLAEAATALLDPADLHWPAP